MYINGRTVAIARIWLLGALVLGVLTVSVAIALQRRSSIPAQTTSVTTVGVHGLSVPKSINERVKEAATVALVTVDSVEAARWNTPDGRAPADVAEYTRQTGEAPIIYQSVHLRVDKYLKKPQKESTLTIHQLGGQVDGVNFVVDNAVVLTPGMQAVVFFSRKQLPSPVNWGLYSVYVIDGTKATSKEDQKTLPLKDLFDEVAKAPV